MIGEGIYKDDEDKILRPEWMEPGPFGFEQSEGEKTRVELENQDEESRMSFQKAFEFLKTMGLPDKPEVIYPGSGQHAVPADVFGPENTVMIDPIFEDSVPGVEQLRKDGGYEIFPGTIEDYLAENQEKLFDVAISENAGGLVEQNVARILRPEGYVLANNWHSAGNSLGNNSEFKLLGAIRDDQLRTAEEAVGDLGYKEVAIMPNGKVTWDKAEIESLRGTVHEEMIDRMPKNTEEKFIFQYFPEVKSEDEKSEI